jgi:multiple sugar transport system permease protein
VLVWLFMLQPGISPWGFVLHALGYHTLGDSLASGNLSIVFALIAFWTGAGGWILVIHGALTNIPEDVLEAAALDGAGPLQTALRVKLPLIKKWIVYMLIVAFAGGTQLFAEPQLISQASQRLVNPLWSPNTLATYLAFQYDNFNYAAAIAIDLLVVALVCAGLLVFRTGLFKAD